MSFPRSPVSRGLDRMYAETQPEVTDRLMDMYVEWREECIVLWEAYERWKAVPPAETALAFAAYRAALDREEWAAHVYADLVGRIMPSRAGKRADEPIRTQRLAA
jgi:hypothetical protein